MPQVREESLSISPPRGDTVTHWMTLYAPRPSLTRKKPLQLHTAHRISLQLVRITDSEGSTVFHQLTLLINRISEE